MRRVLPAALAMLLVAPVLPQEMTVTAMVAEAHVIPDGCTTVGMCYVTTGGQYIFVPSGPSPSAPAQVDYFVPSGQKSPTLHRVLVGQKYGDEYDFIPVGEGVKQIRGPVVQQPTIYEPPVRPGHYRAGAIQLPFDGGFKFPGGTLDRPYVNENVQVRVRTRHYGGRARQQELYHRYHGSGYK